MLFRSHGEHGAGDADVADAAHVDGGKEAGDIADDAAAKGEQDGVAVRAREDELLGEGFDGGEAFVAFAGREEEDGWLGVGWEAGEETPMPESPDLGRGDDEGLGRLYTPASKLAGDPVFARVELAQAWVEGAQKAGADGDVV